MANINNPHGFRPLMVTLSGAPCAIREFGKPATDANAIFVWDLVRKLAVSDTGLTDDGPLAAPGIQTYSTGTPGTTLVLGVSLNYGAASVATYHSVVDSIDTVYETQGDGSTAITVAGSVGKNANISLTAGGNTLTKLSGMQLNSASIAATAGLDLRILDLLRIPTNAEGVNAICEVTILKHQYAQGAAGV